MPDLLWCALSGFVAGVLVSLPVWVWVARRERHRAEAYDRLARETRQAYERSKEHNA